MQIEKQRSKRIKLEHGGGLRYLPNEIVREILSRLPVKSLLRYMSVSSQWKSLISDNSFKKLQRQNNSNPPLMLGLQFSNLNSQYVLAILNLQGELVQQWSLPIVPPPSNLQMLPIPSQSKLVCFVNNERFYMYNPSTRRLFCPPDPPSNPIPKKYIHSSGFGYVPSKDEYVLVHFIRRMSYWSWEILTASTSHDDDELHYNSWRFTDATTINHLHSYRFMIFVCEAFYWIVYDVVSPICLLSFHIRNEAFSTVQLPQDLEYHRGCRSLLEIKGELYYARQCYSSYAIKLWTLSDVKNHVWTQKCNISLQGIPHWRKGFNANAFIYRREYLQQYYKEPYDGSRDIVKLNNRPIGPFRGLGIHTNIFSF